MTRLARIGKNGRIWINPNIVGKDRKRVMRHMRVFKKLRKQKVPRNKAIREALKAEHSGMNWASGQRL